MARLFISYRRQDSEWAARVICDQLAAHFGKDSIFMDVDTLAPGDDYVSAIEQAVGNCDVLLAIIGPQWVDVRGEDGQRRLDDPHDFVRAEIAAAFHRNVRVIPVLLGNAPIPRDDQLPPDIVSLTRRQVLEISPKRAKKDTALLIEAIERAVNPGGMPPVVPTLVPEAPGVFTQIIRLVVAVCFASFLRAGGEGIVDFAWSLTIPAAPASETTSATQPTATLVAFQGEAPADAEPAIPPPPIAEAKNEWPTKQTWIYVSWGAISGGGCGFAAWLILLWPGGGWRQVILSLSGIAIALLAGRMLYDWPVAKGTEIPLAQFGVVTGFVFGVQTVFLAWCGKKIGLPPTLGLAYLGAAGGYALLVWLCNSASVVMPPHLRFLDAALTGLYAPATFLVLGGGPNNNPKR